MEQVTPWGPSGEVVYERTYSRPKPDGAREVWPETVARVAKGNLALVHGDDVMRWPSDARAELRDLVQHMLDFRILPAGRHLWATGVPGRQHLMNCWTSGWGEHLSEHFEFTFLRLMEGGGVGANYSSHHIEKYGLPQRYVIANIVCDPDHEDYASLYDETSDLAERAEGDPLIRVTDTREGWAAALAALIDVAMIPAEHDPKAVNPQHVHMYFDVSDVRPLGSPLVSSGGVASGPLPFALMLLEVARILNNAVAPLPGSHVGSDLPTHLTPTEVMEIDHAIAQCVVAGGNRRSARMSIVRWDDPFVWDFLTCKADKSLHWTTNISVEVDDDFFAALGAVSRDRPAADLDGQALARHERAVAVHQAVVEGMLANGEPGYWNSSLSNEGEVEPVYATNPCGEITLQAWEACNLGHVNMQAFAPRYSGDVWNEGGMHLAHRLVTRMLIRATYADIADPKSRAIQDRNRRIGVGHTGVQGFIVKNGWRYSDVASRSGSPGYWAFRELVDRLRKTVRHSARTYAHALRIPEPVKVTTVAPVGSVSKLAGVPEGIHPIYARHFEQRIRFNANDPVQARQVQDALDKGYATEVDSYDKSGNTLVVVYPTRNVLVDEVVALGYDPSIVEQADEISLDAHLAFQALYQKHYADNAVSFTVNMPAEPHQEAAMLADPSGDVPAPTPARVTEVAGVVEKFLPVLKGTTIMLDGSRVQAPLTRITAEQYEESAATTTGDAIDMDCATGACPIK